MYEAGSRIGSPNDSHVEPRFVAVRCRYRVRSFVGWVTPADRRPDREAHPLKYMLLIYSNQKAHELVTEAEGKKIHDDYMTYTTAIIDSGEFVSGDPLQGV